MEQQNKPTKHEFFRDIQNYVLINNSIHRRDYDTPGKLNPTPVAKGVFKDKFEFTENDYRRLPELDGYVCEPKHLDEYEQIIGGKWNTYSQVQLKPKPGEWPTIKKLIQHLYGQNAVEDLDQTEELYDYHTVMLKSPKERLHGRILFSHTQGTSKSALAELEMAMFGDNVAKIRDNEFESTFNALWVTALMLWLDEPNFNNPKKMSRIIRDLVTSNTMNLRKMQTDYLKVSYYGKFLITTNDTNFMPIENGDRRYWIRETTKFAAEAEDPLFLQKMKAEVNHYVHFLLHERKMKYSKKSGKTFWLPDSIITTNGFKKMVGDNTNITNPYLSTIIEILEQWFINRPNAQECKFRLKDIKTEIARSLDIPVNKISELLIVTALRDLLQITQPQNNSRAKKDDYVLNNESAGEVGKWWTIDRTSSQLDVNVDIFNTSKIGA